MARINPGKTIGTMSGRFVYCVGTLLLLAGAVSVVSLCVETPDGNDVTHNAEDSVIYNQTVSIASGSILESPKDVTESITDAKQLEVDLLQEHHVTGLTLVGDLPDSLWLLYSVEGRVWTNYTMNAEQRFMKPRITSGNRMFRVKLQLPVQARYLRVVVSGTYIDFSRLQIEVYGCSISPGNQTLVIDDIKSVDVTWFPSNNPYIVSKVITIDSSSSLSVNPGVRVLFTGDAGMMIKGKLLIRGSENNPAVFSGIHGNKWVGFSVNNGSLSVTHSVIEGAVGVVTTGEPSDTVTLLVDNSRLSLDKVEMRSRLFNVKVTNSELNIPSSVLSITNQIRNDTSESTGSIHISKSVINSKNTGAVLGVSSDQNVTLHSVKVKRSEITGGNGISVESKNETFNLVIEGNTFKTRGFGTFVNGRFSTVTISGNRFNVNGTSVDLNLGETVGEEYDNQLHGSHRYGYVVLNWRQEKIRRTHKVNTKVLITRNTITRSKVRVTCPYTILQPVNVSNNVFERSFLVLGTPDVSIKRNNFRKHTPAIEYKGKTYALRTIDASYNYWGCRSTALLGRKIMDYRQDTNLPRINIMPYFKDRAMKTLVSKTSFLICDGKLGGPVGGDVVLSRDKSPYTAVSHIYVSGQDSLTVEAGVKIVFREGVNLVVDGSLFIHGSPTSPVQLLSETPGKPWGGLILGKKNRPAIRLAGGSDDREGTVLVWSRSRYRPLCVHREKEFNQTHGQVVCNMAGFRPSDEVTVGPRTTFSGAGPRQFYSFATIECTGKEKDLIYCSGEESGCGISFGEANKPTIRCLGDRLEEDFTSHILLQNVRVNDTVRGIIINGNVSVLDNVTSQFSRSNGMTFDPMFTAKHLSVLKKLDASYNQKDGIVINSDKSYRVFRLEGCTLNSNKDSGLRLTGYPTVWVEGCDISGNRDGILSHYHSVLNLTVLSSTLLHNTERAVYIKYGEIIPMLLWGTIFRAQINAVIANTTFSHRYKKYTIWPGLEEWNSNDICLICFYSYNGTLQITDNVFSNNTNKYILKVRSQTGRVEIQGNSFANNSVDSVVLVQSLVDQYYRQLSNTSVSITNNTFQNNSGLAVAVLDLEDNFQTVVTGNRLVSNSANYTLWLHMQEAELTNNTFINPLSSCEVHGPSEYNVTEAEAANDFNQNGVEMVHSEACSRWKYSFVCGACLHRQSPGDSTTSTENSTSTDTTS